MFKDEFNICDYHSILRQNIQKVNKCLSTYTVTFAKKKGVYINKNCFSPSLSGYQNTTINRSAKRQQQLYRVR